MNGAKEKMTHRMAEECICSFKMARTDFACVTFGSLGLNFEHSLDT